MKSLRLNEIDSRSHYRIDLVQLHDGNRLIYVRLENADRHPETAMSTVALSGERLLRFLTAGGPKNDIETEGGDTFVLDGHNSWMLTEEALFWRECRKNDVEDWTNGPWVNGKMPSQLAK